MVFGVGGTYIFMKKKYSSAGAQPTQSEAQNSAPAMAEKSEPVAKQEPAETANSGLTRIQMLRLDPQSFVNRTAKIYVGVLASDYYNFGYSDARDSHFAFKACDGEGRENCANFFMVKDKARPLLQKIMEDPNHAEGFGPVTLIVSNLKFRYQSSSSEEFEILDYRMGIDKNLSSAGYTVPDFLSQMGITPTQVQTAWIREGNLDGSSLWVPRVRIYFKNSGTLSLNHLNLQGSFVEVSKNESFGTGEGSLSYNEKLEPGQSRFLDVHGSIGYRNNPPYPIPLVKVELQVNKSEIGAITFTDGAIKVSSVKVEELKPADSAQTQRIPAQTK